MYRTKFPGSIISIPPTNMYTQIHMYIEYKQVCQLLALQDANMSRTL